MKACLIGLGRMGIRHLEALKNLGIEISGLADLRAELFDNAKNILESPDSIEFSTDPNALIKKLRPEVVVIATTATSHYQYVMEAANNGAKFILCEKPMATSIGQCEEMIKVCNEKKIKLAINHPVRFTEADIEIKNLVNSAKFGGIESITINVGNYGIAMNAGHDIEMFKFLTNDQPKFVQAWLDEKTLPNPRGPEFVDRSGILKITTRTGKTLFINTKATHGHGAFVIYTSKNGQLFYDALTDQAYANYRQEEHRDAPTNQYAKPSNVENLKFSSSSLVERTGKVLSELINNGNYPSGEDVISTIKCLVAAYVSNENNNSVIDIENFPLPKDRVFPWA